MSSGRIMPAGASRALAALGLAVAVATCRDALGPRPLTSARIAVAPILPSVAALAEFGLTIDRVRFIVVRPPADTIADTTLALPPDVTELALDLRVPLVAASETLSVSVVALSGTIPLFAGTSLVPVPSPLPPTVVPLDTYVGPAADSIVIQPRDPFILVNDSLRFQVQGFHAAGEPVPQFYVAWSTSDTGVARINQFGVLRAPASRGSVRVRARTPSGARDSVTATFTLPATQLVLFAGDAQAGTVDDTLVTPLEVRALAADGFGVGGVIVNFLVTAGRGSVGAPQDTTDGSGLATAGNWTLGTTAGTNTLQASAAGLQPVTFTATGVAGPVARLAFLTEPAHALAGDTIDPAVQVVVQDQFGNTVFPAGDIVTLQPGPTRPDSAAKLLGTVDAAAFNGVAVFSDLAIDSAGIGYTLVATAANLTGAESKPFDVGGVIGAIPVTRGPVAAGLNVQTKKLYVPGSTAVSVLLDDTEVKQILGFEQPFGVAVNSQTNQIYVSTSAGVLVIDGSADAIRTTIPVGPQARGIAVDEQADRIYVAVNDSGKGTGSLVPIDGKQDAVVTGEIVPLPDSGVGVAFSPNDGFVYVAIPRQNAVVVTDTKGDTLVTTIQVGKGAYGVAVDVRTNVLYVTNRDENTVSIVDLQQLKEVTRIVVGRLPEGLGTDAERGVVYVGNSGENTVSLIDAGKFTVFATLIVGPTPKAAVVDPVTGRVHIPTQLDDLVRVIQP